MDPRIKETFDKIWPKTKVELEKAAQKAKVLITQGERHVKELSEKGSCEIKKLSLNLQKEKTYLGLGKAVSATDSAGWEKDKKISDFLTEIKKLDRIIKGVNNRQNKKKRRS